MNNPAPRVTWKKGKSMKTNILTIINFALNQLIPRIEIHNDLRIVQLFDEQTCISIHWLNDDYSVALIDAQTGEFIRDYGIVSEQTALNIIDGWM